VDVTIELAVLELPIPSVAEAPLNAGRGRGRGRETSGTFGRIYADFVSELSVNEEMVDLETSWERVSVNVLICMELNDAERMGSDVKETKWSNSNAPLASAILRAAITAAVTSARLSPVGRYASSPSLSATMSDSLSTSMNAFVTQVTLAVTRKNYSQVY
jgi:hypothetical protein